MEHLREELRSVALLGYYADLSKSEILTLKWIQVDFEGRTVRLDPGITKNMEGRIIYMTDELESLLRVQWQKPVIAQWVFQNN